MSEPLRVLIVEDSADDAELVVRELRRGGFDPEWVRVETAEAMKAALDRQSWDVIISDYALPQFSMPAALATVKKRGLDLPFLIVSGTIGEDLAVAAMKAGAHDYLMKEKLARLVPAVKRELNEAAERQARRQGEEQIRQQAALLDITLDAILVQDLQERIRYWNKSAERLYGWTAAEAIAGKVDELLFRGSASYAEAKQAVLDSVTWKGEMRQVSRDGREIIVDSQWTLVHDAANQPASILIVNTDITERKQLEARMLRTQRMESIGSLAGGIAHDLNNILTPILMGTQLLRLRLADIVDMKLLGTIESNAQRGADIVKQILSFARGVEGQQTVLQIKHLVHEIEQIVKETFPRSIQIQTRLPKGLWMIQGDATHLYQVLMNLVVNARDALPDGGLMEIEADNVMLDEMTAGHAGVKPGPFLVITINDSGTGIPPDLIGHIFDPFFTTKEPGKGSGLGLSTVSGIVKGHGGFINVASELGQGTKFKIFLPAVAAAEGPPAAGAPAELPVGHGELVLVIDDEAAMREMIKATLEAFRYRVVTSNNGKQALSLCERNIAEVDVVVTDMMMPFLGGLATIRALQKLDPCLKFIAMSGMADDQQAIELEATDQIRFLSKPFSTEQLLGALQEVLNSP